MIDSASAISRVIRLALTLGAFGLVDVLSAATEAKAKDPTVVQGVVEVINDVLRQPYVRTITSDGIAPIANFDIPTGKRLIIETISFQASGPTSQYHRMFLEVAANGFVASPLVVQERVPALGSPTNEYLISTIQTTIRLNSIPDGLPNSTSEFRIRRSTGGGGDLGVTVYGYLVDIGS